MRATRSCPSLYGPSSRRERRGGGWLTVLTRESTCLPSMPRSPSFKMEAIASCVSTLTEGAQPRTRHHEHLANTATTARDETKVGQGKNVLATSCTRRLADSRAGGLPVQGAFHRKSVLIRMCILFVFRKTHVCFNLTYMSCARLH